jgi:uncharacterized protein DUF6364
MSRGPRSGGGRHEPLEFPGDLALEPGDDPDGHVRLGDPDPGEAGGDVAGQGFAGRPPLWDPVVHSYTGSMKRNVTLQLDDEVIRRAKVLAAKRGTSVSGLVAAELVRLVAEDERYEEAWRRARKAMGDAAGRGGRRWEREELHER